MDEFVFYQGLRDPIKIWRVEYLEDILVKEEFFGNTGEYAEFDNLTFRERKESRSKISNESVTNSNLTSIKIIKQ